ncbi:DUF2461 domain-containing protein [Dysgonomonas sp. 521]|uniref:DUF2461 domain-containing protein n=1 Tax=Dysgonomonas sp. 521 TaxID=2302932 RepID=UPI0013D27409|nr:DUF2461 domain-containing protein [Dysgonomonas sp. 521]NDV93314.1 DUF2461 domain-containing protein [Dysgonomonas sp. 521]
MKDLVFNGFTPGTFQFFADLKENNYKEWFDAHKDVYEKELLNPLKALVAALSPAMYNIDQSFELRPHRCLSRIYRDTRFSKNKDPYKDFMWMAFQIPVTNDVWKDYPGFFMDISATGYTLGLGLFQPKKKVMDAFRDEIRYDAEEFQRVTQKTVLDRGYIINGEEYKRPIPNDLPEYFQPWMNRKGIWVSKAKPIGEELYSAQLADIIKEDFAAMEWLYNFMKQLTVNS